MKKLLLISVLTAFYATSSNALIIGTAAGRSDCMPGQSQELCIAVFVSFSSTSLPTLLMGADVSEMSKEDKNDFARAEAQNFLDGVPGDYLILNLIAKNLNTSLDVAALELLK
jgi:hypothetical protein